MGLPSDWTTNLIADGLMCYPPDGPSRGGIRVVERRTPVEPFKAILQRSVPAIEEVATQIKVGTLEEITTAEGEYGALAIVSGVGRVDGVPMDAAIAIVYGEDFYDRIDGYVTGPDTGQLLPAIREFVYEYRLGLGQDRHRPYKYDPPPGWVGIRRGLLTEWIHPDFPRHFSRINVSPAMPFEDSPASQIALSMLYRKNSRFRKLGPPVKENFTSTHGLSGIVYHIRGTFPFPDQPETEMYGCVLRDERYIHMMRLETIERHLPEDREVLQKMASSIQPIPRRASKKSDVFVHWSE